MTISEALLARWRRVPTAVVADITGGACQLDPDIRPLRPAGQQPALFGRALTAECPPADIGAVIGALELAKRGDVLVIAAGGHRHTATIGEILGGYLRARGAAGIICDGAVRDVGALGTWNDFSVFSRFVTPRGPTSFAQGAVNGVVSFGGRKISPGDLVIGDDDGLVRLTPEDATTWIEAAEEALKRERQWQEALATGKAIREALGLPSG